MQDKIELSRNAVGHYQIETIINGIKASLILDTGASATCIDRQHAEKFGVTNQIADEEKASGLGTLEMQIEKSEGNTILLGKHSFENQTIAILDLSHVNQALESKGSEKVDGILGIDVLKKSKAVLDFDDDCLIFPSIDK